MEGRTTLVIAHRLSTISLADRVILLEGGRVVADGTHAELLETSPLYAEVLAQVDAEAEAEAELLRAQPATASFRPTPTRDLAPPTMPGGLLS
jgi:ATP-binding cassette subfamily B protein